MHKCLSAIFGRLSGKSRPGKHSSAHFPAYATGMAVTFITTNACLLGVNSSDSARSIAEKLLKFSVHGLSMNVQAETKGLGLTGRKDREFRDEIRRECAQYKPPVLQEYYKITQRRR